MSGNIVDTFFGRGALDQRFTDWDTARNFVIFETIVPNPRLTDVEKVRLQSIEEQAFDMHGGQWSVSETEEIAQYYAMLRNSFPSATSDERFLAIYEAAAEVRADKPSVTPDDFFVPKNVGMGMILAAVTAVAFLAVRK
tara:strand:+ start:276 stop:692 length:417 start_codon:yes stop_codon:yes gene_type:complete